MSVGRSEGEGGMGKMGVKKRIEETKGKTIR